jgi:hypothetical protein
MSASLCGGYQSSCRNEVQQLLVSLSRNYYVGADGNLRVQKKPFEFNFNTVSQSSKKLMVSYLLRDHFSGVYYAEATTHDRLLNLGSFLFRAWGRKEGYEFCGMPLSLLVPQLVVDKWPQLLDLLDAYNITALKPRSGFETGMIDIKNWQRDLYESGYVGYMIGATTRVDYNFQKIREKQLEVCVHAAEREIDGERKTKLEKWLSSKTPLNVPESAKDFEKYFRAPSADNCDD